MDKKDIYWCLTSEGFSSMVTSHPGVFFSPIENYVAGYIVNKLVALAKKRECEECIKYIVDNKSNPKLIEIALFDLLMKEYVWHMGEICYKQNKNLFQGIRGMYALFFGSENSLRKWTMIYSRAFVNVYKRLNKFSYVILTNLLDPLSIISEVEYKQLSNKYIVNSHVKFEELLAPIGHSFETERFIDIITNKDRRAISEYYKHNYSNYTFLEGGFKGDYPKYFFEKLPEMIFGNDDIYKL